MSEEDGTENGEADKGVEIVDVEKLGVEELEELRSSVLRELATRARSPVPVEILYDRHGSGHAKNSALNTIK